MKAKCPQCGGEAELADNPARPFCSERCRLIDLGGWLSGRYAIAGDPPEPEEELRPPAGGRQMKDAGSRDDESD